MLAQWFAAVVETFYIPETRSLIEEDDESNSTLSTAVKLDQVVLNVKPMSSITPQFRNQKVFTKDGVYWLDRENAFMIKNHWLQPESTAIPKYLHQASQIQRVSGPSAFNRNKPRRELCYTPTGEPFRYSRIQHPTIKYPRHVQELLPKFLETIDQLLANDQTVTEGGQRSKHRVKKNPYTKLSSGIDIVYSDEFERGGSVGTHSDDDMHWPVVVIFNLGQTRWLRVRNKKTKAWYNARLQHNSLIIMYGDTFQERYTHQVDKLGKRDIVGTRLSLNVRFISPDSE
jgi:alkylated DNA repair dioxygenase AlkB